MEMKCLVCHQRFETVRRTICNDCFTRILNNIEHPQDGVCPVCGAQSPVISRRRNKKYCSKRCSGIAHGVITRKYGIDNKKSINEKKRERTRLKNIRRHRNRSRIDDIAMIGKSMNKSYGITRMLLKQRADREGVSMDVVIENVCLEIELAGSMAVYPRQHRRRPKEQGPYLGIHEMPAY